MGSHGDIELVFLGTGAGATFVYYREVSSSFVVLRGGEPVLLCDLGYGVTAACRALVGRVPPHIYISHNHGDHSGELPLVLHMEAKAAAKEGRPPPALYSHPDVMPELREHRLRELRSTGQPLEDFASFHDVPSSRATPIGDTGISVRPHRSRHSETCYGLTLYYKGEPFLGWTADSGYDEGLYDALSEAPMLLLDARANANEEHAGFGDLVRIASLPSLRGKRLLVTGYGRQDEAPAEDLGLDVRAAHPGMRLRLGTGSAAAAGAAGATAAAVGTAAAAPAVQEQGERPSSRCAVL